MWIIVDILNKLMILMM